MSVVNSHSCAHTHKRAIRRTNHENIQKCDKYTFDIVVYRVRLILMYYYTYDSVLCFFGTNHY